MGSRVQVLVTTGWFNAMRSSEWWFSTRWSQSGFGSQCQWCSNCGQQVLPAVLPSIAAKRLVDRATDAGLGGGCTRYYSHKASVGDVLNVRDSTPQPEQVSPKSGIQYFPAVGHNGQQCRDDVILATVTCIHAAATSARVLNACGSASANVLIYARKATQGRRNMLIIFRLLPIDTNTFKNGLVAKLRHLPGSPELHQV